MGFSVTSSHLFCHHVDCGFRRAHWSERRTGGQAAFSIYFSKGISWMLQRRASWTGWDRDHWPPFKEIATNATRERFLRTMLWVHVGQNMWRSRVMPSNCDQIKSTDRMGCTLWSQDMITPLSWLVIWLRYEAPRAETKHSLGTSEMQRRKEI